MGIAGLEGIDFVSDHGTKASIGMIGRGSAYPASQITVEAFEPTRSAQEAVVSIWMAQEHSEIGDSGPEVVAETTDGFWLGGAVAADNRAITLEDSGQPFGVPDVPEVAQDRRAAAAFFFVGELVVVDANGIVEIA